MPSVNKLGIEPPTNPEAIRDGKGWLSRQMTGHSYSPTIDQPALASCLKQDFARVRVRSRSFDKFYRDVVRILNLPVSEEARATDAGGASS